TSDAFLLPYPHRPHLARLIRITAPVRRVRLVHEVSLQFIFDMDRDDVVEASLDDRETERDCASCVKIPRPAFDYFHDRWVRLSADTCSDALAGNAFKCGDLLADRDGEAGH